MSPAQGTARNAARLVLLAWLTASFFYAYQYVIRSSPGVMVVQLSQAFGLTAGGLSALLGLFYYGYAPFGLVAGLAMDQLGPRKTMPVAAFVAGVGCIMLASGDRTLGSVGSFLQGAASIFAIVGTAYIATSSFPASRAATLIGATQMMGMAGASAGQFLVGPAIDRGLAWNQFWLLLGVLGLPLALLLAVFIPSRPAPVETAHPDGSWVARAVSGFGAVLRNPQSILCGLIAGLIFIPTTIFGMVWGVRFLQESHDLPYTVAVLRSASVPLGWIIGSPLAGWLSDRIGRRKPVIIGFATILLVCLLLILFAPAGTFPPYSLGLTAGIASGAAMIPYSVIKEANRPEHSGIAYGVISFVNFMLSALLGPILGGVLARASAGGTRELTHYQTAFQPLAYGIALAIVLTFFLRETGPAARPHSEDSLTGQQRAPDGFASGGQHGHRAS
jgi:MFS family permease